MTEQVEILVLTADLFFGSQLQGKLQQAGRSVRLISTPEAFQSACESADLVGCVVDLETPQLDPAEIAGLLKSRGAFAIGYAPHVKGHLFERAREAGFDKLLSRGAIVQQLTEIVSEL